MITIVYENSAYRAGKLNLNWSQFFLITDDDILDHGLLHVGIVQGNIKLMLSEDVLTSEITCLLDGKAFNTAIFFVRNGGLKYVDATGGKPLVTPFFKFKVISHGFVIGFFISSG
jgi:hypothetical protein